MKALAKTKASIAVLQQLSGVITAPSSKKSFNYASNSINFSFVKKNIVEQVFSKHNNSSPPDIPIPVMSSIYLNPKEYKKWTKEQVCSLLLTTEENGGVGLTIEDVKPLYDAGFKGTSIDNIVASIQEEGKKEAIEKLETQYTKAGILLTFGLITTLNAVVNWIESLLQTNLYHVWTVNYLCKQINDKKLSKRLRKLNFDGQKLDKVVRDLNTGGIDFATRKLKDGHKWQKIPIDAKSIVLWSVKFSVKPKAQDYLEKTILSNSEKDMFLKIIDSLNLDCFPKDDFSFVEQLFPIIEKLEQAFKLYGGNSSKEVFNSLMKPYGLNKEDSLIHLYLSKEEQSASSSIVCCDFAPTFPPDKYQEREKFLNESSVGVHSVSTFLEAPGSGKTHFAYHLSKNNKYLVIPIDKLTCESLISNLEKLQENNNGNRLQLNSEVKSFHRFLTWFSSFIYRYCKTNFPNHEHVLNRDVMRFLNNCIKEDISNLYNELRLFKLIPKPTNVKIVWLLDEAHILANTLQNIPITTTSVTSGNLLTLLASQFRTSGPVVLTTTFSSSVEGKIEEAISHTPTKIVLEKFSYDFTKPLPLLHAKEVVLFLENFISIDKNDEIWKLVSYFVQGPYRTSSAFLQYLLQNCNKYTYASRNALIYDSLVVLFEEYIQKELNFQKKWNSHPEYRDLVFNLALFGKYQPKQNFDQKKKFLILNGISFTINYTSNCFKVISPIDRIRLMKALQKLLGNDWIQQAKATLNVSNHEQSHCAEIEITYKIMNNFNSIISKYFRETDYISKYELKALYIAEDSETSNTAEEKDEKYISTLILKTIRDNMNGFSIENSYPLIDISSNFKTTNEKSNENIPKLSKQYNSNVLPQIVVKPCENAGPDVIGILMLKSEFSDLPYPKCIPMTIAITLMNDLKECQKNYETTNIANMFCEHVGLVKQRISGKNNEQNERQKIERAIQLTTNSGKILRILVHPNVSPTNTIKERIQRISDLSNNKDCVAENETPTINSVIFPNGNCVLELYQNDLVL